MHHQGRTPSSLFTSSYITIIIPALAIMMLQLAIKVSFQQRHCSAGVMGVNAFSSFVSMNKNQRSIFYSAVSSQRLAVVASSSTSTLKSRVLKRTVYMWGEQPSSKNEGVPPRIPQFQTLDYSSSLSRPIRPPRRGGNTSTNNDNDSGEKARKSDWFDDDDATFQNNDNNLSSAPASSRVVRRGEEERRGSNYTRKGTDMVGGGDYRGSSRSDENHRRSYDDNYQQQQRGRGEERGGRGGGRGGRGGRERGGRGSDRRDNSFSRGEGRSWGNNDNPRRRSFDREEFRGEGGRNFLGRGSLSSTTIDTNSNLAAVGKINLRAIESAGYEHVYGIAPVLNALKSNVRDFDSSSTDDGMNDDDRRRFDDISRSLDDDDDDDEDTIDDDRWSKKKVESSSSSNTIKPEAKLSPHLFVQEGTLNNNNGRTRSNSMSTARSDAKKEASIEILSLARSISLPIIEVDKGVLNSLCGSRPHQGFVLRCGKLDFVAVRRVPKVVVTSTMTSIIAATTDSLSTVAETGPSLWLALDEVVDPQNLGALLRSAYFLGGGDAKSINDKNYDDDESALNNNNGITRGKVGIIVCSKNSSPLTPTVSAASAGAVEFMSIYSTTNLPKLLYTAQEDGWRILGAAADVPDGASRNNHDDDDSIDDNEDDYNEWVMSNEGSDDDDSSNVDNSHAGSSSIATTTTKLQPQCFDLNEVNSGRPTIIVLGSEGRGLRTLVSRACTGFVRIPGGRILGGSISSISSSSSIEDDDKNDENDTQSGVDSLNVSVTGGILLWHFLSKQ